MANKLLLDLSGGMNSKTSPLIIKDNECELAVNYHLDKIGALTKRTGYTQFASQPVSGKRVVGLYNFSKSSGGATEQLMVVNNAGDTASDIYYNNAGTWTVGLAMAFPFGTANTSRFATFVDYVFHVDLANGVDSSTDGVTWGTTNCPSGNFEDIAVFQDRVYLGQEAGANLRSRLKYSSLPSGGTITWGASDYVDINPDDGDRITALENNGNRLLIFKNRSMYRWNFGQVEADRVIGVGTSAKESVKTNFDIGVTFFANQNGVYAYSGGRPELISRKIQQYIDAVSDWTTATGGICAGIDNDHYYLSVGNITVEGKTITNAVFVYHITLDAWTIYSFANRPFIFARMIETQPEEALYFGSNDGKTYKMDDAINDAGTTIVTEFTSKEYLISFPYKTDLVRIDTFSNNPGTTQLFYDLDRANKFQSLGVLNANVNNFRVTPLRECRSVRINISDASAAQSDIAGFNFEWEQKLERDQSKKTKNP